MNDTLLSDWLKSKSVTERNAMKRWARVSRAITITANVIAYSTIGMFFVLPWIGISTRIVTSIDGIDQRFILQSYFFYDTSKTVNFIATYVIQCVGALMSGISYTAVDNYLTIFVFHICGQFYILKNRIFKLGEPRDFKHALTSFIEIIDDSFTMMLLVLLVYFGILFCFYGFFMINQVSTVEDLSFGRMMFVVSSGSFTFSHMCMFCIIGEILVTQCESIYHMTYDCKWYTLNPGDAKCLTCLMIRAGKPRYLTAGKLFPVTMSTFCSLLKTSAGYVSVLLANQN